MHGLWTVMFIVLVTQINAAEPLQTPEKDRCILAVHSINTSLPRVTLGQVRNFLSAFGSLECESNVEFAERGNEVLWDLIERQPKLFFDELFKADARIVKRIKREINNPINDGINVLRRYSAVEAADLSPELKKHALSLLRPSRDAEEKWIRKWETQNGKKWEYPK